MLLIGSIDNPFSSDYIHEDYLTIKKLFSKKQNSHLIELLNYLNSTELKNWEISKVENIDNMFDPSNKQREKNKEIVYRNYKYYMLESKHIDFITVEILSNLKSLLLISNTTEANHKDLNYQLFDFLANTIMEDLEITDEEISNADNLCSVVSISNTEFVSILQKKSSELITKLYSTKSFNSIEKDELDKIRNYYEFLNKKGLKYDIEGPISFLNSYNVYRYSNNLELFGIKINIGLASMINYPIYGGYTGKFSKMKKIKGQNMYEQNNARIYNYGEALIIAYKYSYIDSFTGNYDSILFSEIKDYGNRVFLNTGEKYLYLHRKGDRNPYAISDITDLLEETHFSIIKSLIAKVNSKTQLGKVTRGQPQMTPKMSNDDNNNSERNPSKNDSNDVIDINKEHENENFLEELNKLIGLDEVKAQINSLINYIKVQKMRSQKDLKTSPITLHSVFTGSPGTGKTTVARLYGGILKQLGILKKGQLVEVDRSGLVAGYLGQTALKVDEMINKALDGILFIDEAYSLTSSQNDSYGEEAVDVLLKRMEDNRDRLVVILAGYTDEMETFIGSNPGLKSRFSRYIKFDNYSGVELMKIFKLISGENEYKLTEQAETFLEKYFEKIEKSGNANFGNGRFVRNAFETVMEQHANRIVNIPNPTDEDMINLSIEDVKNLN